MHPHTLYSCRESMLEKSIALAEEYDVGFATHLLESPEDRVRSDERYRDRGGLILWMLSSGLLQELSLFFHCAQLNEEEIQVFAEQGCAVAHNPQANTFFGDVAYVPAMLEAGVKVGLGTDAPICNLFDQIFAANMLHNVMPRDKRGLDPWTPLQLATMGSARALRLEDQIGSLEAGKRADIITIDLSRNTSIYPLNAGIFLGWIAEQGAGTIVCDAMVDGVFLRRENEFTIFDEEAIIGRSDEWLAKFSNWYLEKKRLGQPHVQIVHEDYRDN